MTASLKLSPAALLVALSVSGCTKPEAGPDSQSGGGDSSAPEDSREDSAGPDSGDTGPGPDSGDTGPAAHTGDTATPDRRPNVLLIIMDDLGLDKASFDKSSPCYEVGEPDEDGPMPTLAGLCAAGVRFDSAWAMPTCSALRATILTGTYPYRHGVGAPLYDGVRLDAGAEILPALLTAAGTDYALASFGKWHVSQGRGDPNAMGWPHYVGNIAGSLPAYDDWERVVDGVGQRSEHYATSQNVDDAIAWLSTLPEGQPWFTWLAFNAPHAPFHVPPSDLHSSTDLETFDVNNPPDDFRPYYAAMTEAMDTEIGRFLDTLRARGEYDDTLIIVLGDNGTQPEVISRPYTPESAKGTLSEGGVAVPLIISGPGVRGGRAVAEPVSAIDIFSTVIETLGEDPAALSPETESHSLWPLLRDPVAQLDRDYVLAEQFGGPPSLSELQGKAIRDRQFKLICYTSAERPSMYDLVADPYEQVDLLASEPTLEIELAFERLRDHLHEWTGQEVCVTAEAQAAG